MRCLVRIEGLNTLYSLREIPEDRGGMEVQEGAEVFIPADISDWPPGVERPDGGPTLGRCKTDPKRYRPFKFPEEVEPAGYEPTELRYGAAYSPEQWRRFARGIPALKAFHAIPDDPPGVFEEAMRYIREGR